MFVIEGCGTNETPQLGYLGGLIILAILGCFSATPRRGHVGCRTRESVAPSANRPSRCPKECPGIGRSNGLTASPWWTSSPERFSQIAWRFLVDLPLNQSIEKSEKNLEILGGIACKLCHCDSSIKLAKQIWRIQSCNLTHNHPKQNQKKPRQTLECGVGTVYNWSHWSPSNWMGLKWNRNRSPPRTLPKLEVN